MSINAPNVQRLIALIGNADIPGHLADAEAAAHEIRRIWKLEHGTTAPNKVYPLGVHSDQYPSVDAYRNQCGNPQRPMVQMLAINDIIGGFGIEAAETESTCEWLEHINTGDSYAPTVIYWRGHMSLCDGGLGGFLETWKGPKFK
jgi:hypothetical protein